MKGCSEIYMWGLATFWVAKNCSSVNEYSIQYSRQEKPQIVDPLNRDIEHGAFILCQPSLLGDGHT